MVKQSSGMHYIEFVLYLPYRKHSEHTIQNSAFKMLLPLERLRDD